MLLVMALEQHGDLEDGLLQQVALGAELIGGDRLLLEAERDVEGGDVRGRVGRGLLRLGLGHGFAAGEQGDGGGRTSVAVPMLPSMRRRLVDAACGMMSELDI